MFDDPKDEDLYKSKLKSRDLFKKQESEWESIKEEMESARRSGFTLPEPQIPEEEDQGDTGRMPDIFDKENVLMQMGEITFDPGQRMKLGFAKQEGTNRLQPVEIVKFASFHEDGSLAESGIELKKIGIKKLDANDWITGTRLYDTPND
jgi:hypothetical protein